MRPYLKEKPITKKGWWSGSRYRPNSNSSATTTTTTITKVM
jgi:hypothetical protein